MVNRASYKETDLIRSSGPMCEAQGEYVESRSCLLHLITPRGEVLAGADLDARRVLASDAFIPFGGDPAIPRGPVIIIILPSISRLGARPVLTRCKVVTTPSCVLVSPSIDINPKNDLDQLELY